MNSDLSPQAGRGRKKSPPALLPPLGEIRQRLRIGHDLLEALEIEFFVDEAGAFAVELMRQTAGADYDDAQVFRVRRDRAAERLAELEATVGPRAPAASSKGQDRPWVIDGIHLFDAQMLVESLLSRSLKVGIAASVAAAYWVAAEVYPSPTCKLLEVRDDQRVWLESFGRIRAGV